MRILGLKPGREVGEAYRFLLEVRLDEGPLAEAEGRAPAATWWSGATSVEAASAADLYSTGCPRFSRGHRHYPPAAESSAAVLDQRRWVYDAPV